MNNASRQELKATIQEQFRAMSESDAKIDELRAKNAMLREALRELMKFAGIIEERCGDYETNCARAALSVKP